MTKNKENENRRNTISIRLTDDELARLRFICEKLNLSQSEYIREAILTAKVTRPTVVTAMDRGTAKELLAHFGKAASNLNQIARKLNSGEPADNEIRDAINDCISDMNEERKFLRTVRGYRGDLKALECS